MILSYKIIGIGGVLLLGASAILGISGSFTQNALEAEIQAQTAAPTFSPKNTIDSFSVTSGDLTATYKLGRKLDKEPFIATAVVAHKAHVLKTAGANSLMASLSPKATQKFVKKYPGRKICPASFFNRHAQHIGLYAATPTVAQKLQKWDRRKYTDASLWEDVTISGHCLVEDSTTYTKAGVDITEDIRTTRRQRGSGDCLNIWVKTIYVKPANVVSSET